MADLAGVVKPSLNPSGFFCFPQRNLLLLLPWYQLLVTCLRVHTHTCLSIARRNL